MIGDGVRVKIVDTHCHLQADAFEGNRDMVVSRALDAGVVKIINAATEPSDWEACRSLKKNYPSCEYALGIHPWYINEDSKRTCETLTPDDLDGACAVGEIGLDKRYAKTDIDTQIKIFRLQLEMAREYSLPVLIHCVSAFQELIAEVKRCPIECGGIIHNFNGSADLAKDLAKYNFSFSMGGTLTYRDSRKRAEMLKYIYPTLFLLETDSPDIPPVEKRNETNEPSFIRYNLAAASEILGIDENAIALSCFENAKKIFRKTIII